MRITYEWTIELLDEHKDIVDHRHADKLSEFDPQELKDAITENGSELCIVRDTGDNLEGLVDRMWAYVQNGKLEEFFHYCDGGRTETRVPQKLHAELARFL